MAILTKASEMVDSQGIEKPCGQKLTSLIIEYWLNVINQTLLTNDSSGHKCNVITSNLENRKITFYHMRKDGEQYALKNCSIDWIL